MPYMSVSGKEAICLWPLRPKVPRELQRSKDCHLPIAATPNCCLLRRVYPWRPDPKESANDEVQVRICVEPIVEVDALPPTPAPRRHELAQRQIDIRRNVELKKYGYSEKCPGCTAANAMAPPQPHSDTCRRRIESAMMEQDSIRVAMVGTANDYWSRRSCTRAGRIARE